MIVTFLSAKLPLTKTLNEKGETIRSYPLVKRFTSHQNSIDSISDLALAIKQSAGLNMCMLKGNPVRAINNESRAGLTNSVAPTKILILDYDADALVNSVDELLYEIHPPLQECDHIIQYSASSGFNKKSSLRCHVFFILQQAVSPELLKQWVLDKNFRSPFLRKQLKLTANTMALSYPLDQTVNQNDKLIFIAPPIIESDHKTEDPIKERVLVVPRENRELVLSYPSSPEIVAEEKQKVLNELRVTAGLSKKKPRIKFVSGEEICSNPGKVMVTGQKKERGFVYLNLNGGDSWGYYFSEKSPTIVRNFKGEPFFYLRDVAPELHGEYCKVKNGSMPGIPFVFRDLEADKYYNALIDPETESLTFLHPSGSKDKLFDFLAQYGVDNPEFIDDFSLIFDPEKDQQFNIPERWVNKFRPTEYMLVNADNQNVPETIKRVIKHICVDEETYAHFINWLAFIFQNRTRTETAWVFQGTQGTGKGFVFNQIIRRLLGYEYTQPITLETLQENFNEYLQDKFMIFVDEIDIEHSGHAASQGKLMNKLKNLITEPTIGIRAMHSSTRSRKNYANFIFASNDVASLYIADNDRRFNIAPRQEKPLSVTRDELEASLNYEVKAFASFLKGFAVNVVKARTSLRNEAKRDFITDGKTSIQEFFQCFEDGDLSYFYGFFHKDPKIQETDRKRVHAMTIFSRWEQDAVRGVQTQVSSLDLSRIYYCMQGGAISANKFGRICGKNGLRSISIRLDGKPVRGFSTFFILPPGYTVQPAVLNTKPNIVSGRF